MSAPDYAPIAIEEGAAAQPGRRRADATPGQPRAGPPPLGCLIASIVFVALAFTVLTAAIAFRSGFKAGGRAEQTHLVQQSSQAAAGGGSSPKPRNVVLMIPDGTGPASWTLAREVARTLGLRDELFLDKALAGTSRTRSSNSLVTDSAAGATAFACAQKTANGAISVLPDGRPCGSLFEAAKAKGFATGLVVTSRITHATPAVFGAHVPDRDMEGEIAAQLAASRIDLLLGGGRRFFLPPGPAGPGNRTDGRDLLREMQAAGYALLGRPALDKPLRLPAVGLFAWDHMDFEVDRDAREQPSLAEMAAAGLAALRASGRPFLAMVEGSRVDHAAHANDAQAHARDLLAFDEAAAVALADAARAGDTLVVAVADHECGGLTLAHGGKYFWYPPYVAAARGSDEALAAGLRERAAAGATAAGLAQWLNRAAGCPPNETAAAAEELAGLARGPDDGGDEKASSLGHRVGDLVAAAARLKWTSRGHTGVDVNIHAFGPGAERFRGNMDNTEVGRRIAELLELDLAAASARVQAAMPRYPPSSLQPAPDSPDFPR